MEKYPFNKDRAIKGEPVVDKDGLKFVFVNDDQGDFPLEFKCLYTGYPVYVDRNGQWKGYMGCRIDLYMTTPDPIN